MSQPTKFIHVTDLHLTVPGEPLLGLNTHERLGRCLDDIARWHADAEFCIITGDLATAGDTQAYQWLKDRLADFPLKTHLMIGNHDNRDTFRQVFAQAPADAAGFIQQSFGARAGRFILLDTFKGGTSAGQYCEHRQAWLRAQLNAASGDPVWLFMHHPPFDIGITYMDRIKLEDHEAFAGIISAHDNIRHIFFGHVHRPAYVNWRGIACTCLPAINHQIPLRREAVGGKPYSYEPPMYAVVHIDDDQVVIHMDAYDHRQPAEM